MDMIHSAMSMTETNDEDSLVKQPKPPASVESGLRPVSIFDIPYSIDHIPCILQSSYINLTGPTASMLLGLWVYKTSALIFPDGLLHI
jgi:hypothetical protein